MADTPTRLTATLIDPDDRKPFTVPLLGFTPAAYESFMEADIDYSDRLREIDDEKQRIRLEVSDPRERREALKANQRRLVSLLLLQRFIALQSVIDRDAVKVEKRRAWLEADATLLLEDRESLSDEDRAIAQELDRFVGAQDFERIDRALRSFRSLLGLA